MIRKPLSFKNKSTISSKTLYHLLTFGCDNCANNSWERKNENIVYRKRKVSQVISF